MIWQGAFSRMIIRGTWPYICIFLGWRSERIRRQRGLCYTHEELMVLCMGISGVWKGNVLFLRSHMDYYLGIIRTIKELDNPLSKNIQRLSHETMAFLFASTPLLLYISINYMIDLHNNHAHCENQSHLISHLFAPLYVPFPSSSTHHHFPSISALQHKMLLPILVAVPDSSIYPHYSSPTLYFYPLDSHISASLSRPSVL